MRKYPLDHIQGIGSDQFTSYWKPIWIERFFIWFNSFKDNLFGAKLLDFTNLESAKKTENPWAFVSVLVNLKSLISNHLQIQENRGKIVFFTVLTWGFSVNFEKGLSLEKIYKALLWVYKDDKEWDNLKYAWPVFPWGR